MVPFLIAPFLMTILLKWYKEYLNLTQNFSDFIIFLEDKPERNTRDSIIIKNTGSGVR